MRGVLGCCVLAVGVGCLGFWAANNNAESMEAEVGQGAKAALGTTTHAVTTSAQGRDIVVAGFANSSAERDAILARLNGVDGRRVVKDDLTVLETKTPYSFTAVSDADGQTYSGYTPTEAQRTLWGQSLGDGAGNLELAAGMPDANWVATVDQGLTGLSFLKSGQLSVEGQNVTLSGLAALPAARNAAVAALEPLANGYTLATEIDVEDDGTPMRLTVRQNGGGAVATGKIPNGMQVADIAAGLGLDDTQGDVLVARIPAPHADWANTTGMALGALAQLDRGSLAIADKDVSLTGTATRDGKAAAEQALAGIADGYEVSSEIDLLDDGRPFSLEASFDGEAVLAAGKFPYGMAATDIAAATGADVPSALISVAEIESEDGSWPVVAKSGLAGLAALKSGQLSITGIDVRLTGVGTRAQIAAAEAGLGDLPEGYQVAADLQVYDDGAPFEFNASRTDEGASLSGKLPRSMADTNLMQMAGFAASSDVAMAEIDADGMDWPTVTSAGLSALGELKTGDLKIASNTVTLTGVSDRAGIDLANTALADLSGDVAVKTDLNIFDDGAPLLLTASKTGDTGTATGKLPWGARDLDLQQTAGFGLSTTVAQSELEDPNMDWAAATTAGLTALGHLKNGKLSIKNGNLMLTGDGSRAGIALAEAALKDAPDGIAVNGSFGVYDDGAPLTLEVDATGATAVAMGKLPLDLQDAALDAAFGADVDTSAVSFSDTENGDFTAQASAGLAGLAMVQNGKMSLGGGMFSLKGDVQTAADADAVRAALPPMSGITQVIELSVLEQPAAPPQQGDERTTDEGRFELFHNGAWIAPLYVDPTQPNCSNETTFIVASNKVNFVSGKADLDQSSVATLEALAEVMAFCLSKTTMSVEIAGHTDSSGAADSNQSLSQARAEAVRDALVARDLPADRLVARGFGETQPITENETPEGRAQNRRTEINWSN